MRSLKGWDAVIFFNQSKSTQSCCEDMQGTGAENGHHPLLKSWGVVMIIHDELKSQPCKTIHYTYNEMLEGLRCCEIYESVQT